MLSPVNNAGLNTCQWGSHGWARGEEGEWGDPADAVEKGELTPVKWLIKVWWLPFWGANAGQDSERNSKPHLANWALCRPQAADRKPQIQEILLLDVFTQTAHTTCMKCWCFYFPTQRRSMPSLFYLTAGWWVDLNFVSILYAPKYNAFRPMCGFFYLFKLINEVHSVKSVTTIGATDGSHALRPAREWQEQMWHLLSLALPVPPTLVSPLCCM